MKRRLCAVFVVGTFLSACGGGASNSSTPNAPSSQTTAFQGSVAGTGGQSGTLTMTVQTVVNTSSTSLFRFSLIATLHAQATTVAATGSLHLVGGSTISLTGTFDSTTKALNLSGGGFTFTGTFSGGVLSGTYTGPNGVTGGFSSLSITSGVVTSYCGTFAGGGASGVFNLVVSATGAVSGVTSGVHIDSSGRSSPIYITSGRVSGNTLTENSSDGGTGTGTIQNGAITGTTSNGGTFSGSTSACQ